MPFGGKVQCYQCDKNESFMWHQNEKGVRCNECYELANTSGTSKTVSEDGQRPSTSWNTHPDKPKAPMKKSSKTKPYKTRQNPSAAPKQVMPKGKGRRQIFKKTPTKLHSTRATVTTSDFIYHKGQYFRVGDIVSVRDVEGGIYYAQLRGFMTDEYCEKSASITWLIPTRNNSPFPKEGFDPMTFILGPDDDLPRKIECFTFVMHAPSDYYRDNCPYPSGLPDPHIANYTWGRLSH